MPIFCERNERVKRHLELVRAIAINIQKTRPLPVHIDLEDLCQAGAIALIEAVDQFDGRGTFEGYAGERVRFAMLDCLGRNHQELSLENGPDPRVESHENEIADRDEAAAVARAVEDLPVREQKVIELRYSDGLTMDRIGPQVGVKKTRVLQLHRRAIDALRTNLQAAA